MPIERSKRSGMADRLAVYGGFIKGVVDKDPDNLYAIQELSVACQGDKKTRPHSHLIAVAACILWLQDDVTMEYRGGKILVGAKV